jgi:hypothetical protein
MNRFPCAHNKLNHPMIIDFQITQVLPMLKYISPKTVTTTSIWMYTYIYVYAGERRVLMIRIDISHVIVGHAVVVVAQVERTR